MNVSIIIPAYNAAETISETLESVLTQTFQGWEAIVVDDGSADATSDTVETFVTRDKRISLVRRANGGESAARNTGLARAKFDWILFLDADDWISANHLELVTNELNSHPELDAVHCGSARVAEDHTVVIENYLPPTGDMFPTLARRAAFPIHACVVRKSLVEGVGNFDTSLRKSPDWDLWQRIARTGARFGAVREVLAYYRMRKNAASLEARQMLKDGLRVLRRGHAADPRVAIPEAAHAIGYTEQSVQSQEFYLLCWCAGLLLGQGKDARLLLKEVKGHSFPELYAEAVAQCLFDAAPLPTCRPPRGWEELWNLTQRPVEDFLVGLEKHSKAPDLAKQAMFSLKRLVLKHSETWGLVIDRLEQENTSEQERWRHEAEENQHRSVLLEQERSSWKQSAEQLKTTAERLQQDAAKWQQSAEQLKRNNDLLEDERANLISTVDEQKQTNESQRILLETIKAANASLENARVDLHRLLRGHEQTIDEQESRINEATTAHTLLAGEKAKQETENEDLRRSIKDIDAERNELLHSAERKLGSIFLNRLRLRAPLFALANVWSRFEHWLVLRQLRLAGWFAARNGKRRIIATICDSFPIYSQTFVYQELIQLVHKGFDLQMIYSRLDSRDYLPSDFGHLWKVKRRLQINPTIQQQDFSFYRQRMPEKVENLVQRLSEASGLDRDAVINHGNFLQAFTFMRMVEAYGADYLHSYFFYDRSLMALIAGYLLEIPRGVSCYADHLLKDYEFKIVPLHLELCDVVVATSERIKEELMELAPEADPNRIVVKPNAIDIERFPQFERSEPDDGSPFRLVSVCRLEPKKGLLDLVEATSLLKERGLQVELHLVGTVDEWSLASRDYKRKLDERITELDLWGTVHLEGRHNLEGILRFLKLSHLFVAPFVETETGDKDGIPTALLEALATGLPAVASNTGSIAEVIRDGRNGILVPQGDPVELANAIETLLRDPDRRIVLGCEAAADVRRRYDVLVCESSFHERVLSCI